VRCAGDLVASARVTSARSAGRRSAVSWLFDGPRSGHASRFPSIIRTGSELGTPTPAQSRGWSAIRDGRHTLIAAPTGSGKTLAAFLTALDSLTREALDGPLPDEVRVLYVSPLKALSADIQKNLAEPRRAIVERAKALGLPVPEIRSAVRTGDTPPAERAAMIRTPPHVLVTTPESLYLLLTSERSRALLRTVRTVIVDEIHAVMGTRRGAHLALSLARLEAVVEQPFLRIGLSATQKPIEEVARYLTGGAPCAIVDEGHRRHLDLALELPRSPLEAVMSHEVWEEYYDRLAALVSSHRTTLVFVNTRRMAERIARHLGDRLGEGAVTAHHGSLARDTRLDAEQRLKSGALRALVATASLERHRHRARRSRLPDRLAAPHRDVPAARGPLGPHDRRHAEGTALPVDARRPGRVRGASARGGAGIARRDRTARLRARRTRAADRRRERLLRRTEDDLFALVRRAWPYAISHADSTPSSGWPPTASRRAGDGGRRSCTATKCMAW
jgi:replicative superfamily II helicase